MPDVRIVSQNENFVYDPIVVGYDTTFFKTITGTPAVASNKLRLSAAEVASYSFYRFTDIEFILNVPTAPTTGHVRAWGLKVPALGNKARIEFDITDAVLSCKAYDDAGTETINVPVTWNASWTATDTSFRIRVTPSGIKFFIAGVQVAVGELMNYSVNPDVPSIAQTIHIVNEEAENFDVTAIIARNVQSLS